MILLIDNYDSFTFNLFQALTELGAEVEVVRNDQITIEEIRNRLPEIDGIVISPGPCTPKEAGISVELVQQLAGSKPILGVCLGHQAIGEAFGAVIDYAPELMHGKVSDVQHDGRGVFSGLPERFVATRYHSLVIRPDTLPDVLEITAMADDGVIMGVRHRELMVEGVQFHPESILTVEGNNLLANFLETANALPDGAARRQPVIGY